MQNLKLDFLREYEIICKIVLTVNQEPIRRFDSRTLFAVQRSVLIANAHSWSRCRRGARRERRGKGAGTRDGWPEATLRPRTGQPQLCHHHHHRHHRHHHQHISHHTSMTALKLLQNTYKISTLRSIKYLRKIFLTFVILMCGFVQIAVTMSPRRQRGSSFPQPSYNRLVSHVKKNYVMFNMLILALTSIFFSQFSFIFFSLLLNFSTFF